MNNKQIDATEDENIVEEIETRASLKDMDGRKLTPAMKQYVDIKKEYPQYLLFYRMGDFYELFFEDAIIASTQLGLALTSRSKIEDLSIPMCGVPYHAYEAYLVRLIRMGYKVAICEQVETPEEAKKREGSKAVVKREVVRLVTSGTVTEDSLLDAKSSNYIASICIRGLEMGVSWMDISTGSFYMQNIVLEKDREVSILSSVLARLSPAELLIEDKILEISDFFNIFSEHKDKLVVRSHTLFNITSTSDILQKAYKIKTMDAFGEFSKLEIISAGVLVEYIETTQRGNLPRLERPKRIRANEIMEIDATTRRSLELTDSISPTGVDLLKTINKTVTNMGSRLFAERLSTPIMDIVEINNRLDMIEFFIENNQIRKKLRSQLRKCYDIKRVLQRLSFGKAGPKDLHDLATTLKLIPYLNDIVTNVAQYQRDNINYRLPQALQVLANNISDLTGIEQHILETLLPNKEDLPTIARNGGFVREGVYAPLDYLKNIEIESNNKSEELREKYSKETGVQVKIKNNNLIGYFIEVPTKYADKFFENKQFIHRQSVLNAVRFTTVELSELEAEVNSSAEKALIMENKIFDELSNQVLSKADAIANSSEFIAVLDVASALAEVAVEYNYCRPIVDESTDFDIIEGRHPVVESVIKKTGKEEFMGNDCILKENEDILWLITGPNMAGKSTFLRQNALIAIMAQMGSYVPAKSAKIGIVDKVFSRVGASDELSRGRSTFMVEMVETASILNQATPRSFVILDEIGRGTSTFDGLSIAWAVVEHLSEINRCRTLFATHYHELTKLNNKQRCLSLHCMKTREYKGDVVFLHEIVKGAADRSYGIHVASLAGLPILTIKRAEQVLKILEDDKKNKMLSSIEDDLPLFEVLRDEVEEDKSSEVEEEIKKLDIDSLTPREALDVLYQLKEKLQ